MCVFIDYQNAEYEINKLNRAGFEKYNVWREVSFYEYIREEILKPKMCPNFPFMYSYFIAKNSKIDFRKVHKLSGSKATTQKRQGQYVLPYETQLIKAVRDGSVDKVKQILESGSVNINEIDNSGKTILDYAIFFGKNDIENELKKKGAKISEDIRKAREPKSLTGGNYPVPPFLYGNYKAVQSGNLTLNMEAISPHVLVALTESPNYNLYNWASKTYVNYGNIKKMVHTGYHTKEVWFGVLFQIMAALYAMQKKGIVFRKFSIDDNVYIKDTKVSGNTNTYWKYIIDGISYYIPNHGYLVMIDSNYKDLDSSTKTVKKDDKNNEQKMKIRSRKLYGKCDWSEDIIKKCSFRAFKDTFSSNNFSTTFRNRGGVEPPQEVMDKLSEISNNAKDDKTYDIGPYISEHMSMFINNRIGTYLSDNEVNNIRQDGGQSFKNGNMCVYETQHDTYNFVIYLGEDKNNPNQAEIITKNNPDSDKYDRQTVSKGLLYKYLGMIKQSYKPNQSNPDENNLLETYIM